MGGGASKYKIVADNESNDSSFDLDWLAAPSSKLNPFAATSFVSCGNLGRGKFGIVCLSNHSSGKTVAIKFIPKNIHCFGAYETNGCLAFVFEFAYGGELFTRMKKADKMGEDEAKFYFCEIALALHYLHDTLNIVYRDLKPENILIDHSGHIKLCDFGFAVPMQYSSAIQGTTESRGDSAGEPAVPQPLHDGCGTAMYVAPEIAGGFMNRAHGFPVDWWSLGCVLYEMVVGSAPFGDTDHMSKFEIFNNINAGKVSYPMSLGSKIKGLIKGLLEADATKRFNWGMVKFHSWLADVNWEQFINRKVIPPWEPLMSKNSSPNKGGIIVSKQPANLVEHFVKWELDVPTDASTEATQCCKGINLPKAPKIRAESCIYNADGNIIESRRDRTISVEHGGVSQMPSMKKQMSVRELPGAVKKGNAKAK